jgi:hypothetical protein
MTMSDLFALLIAIDNYFESALPDWTYYPRLGGCVRDVNHVHAFLTDKHRIGLPDDHVIRLSASIGAGAEPPEPRSQWPTYANMVAAFQQVTAMARPGDQVYVHYSGHGGRTITAYPYLKGANGVDEALVPLDIGNPNAQYLRDIELHTLIQHLVVKGVVLTVVFDCCHSGGATRALTQGTHGARARGIGKTDMTVRPLQPIVAPVAELATAWNATTGATRSLKPASGWLLEPSGYTFLAACRANESAYEFPFSGAESNGALTYWMLDTLRSAGPNLSYKQLHDRVLAKVHSQFAAQTPMLQGEGDVRVFGVERIPAQYAAPVLQVNAAGDVVQLNAGEVQGIKIGSRFAIYPLGSADLSDPAASIAEVEVTDVDEVDCFARVVKAPNSAGLDAGAQAVLLAITDIRLQRGVLVDIADAALKQAVETEIQTNGKGFAVLAGPDAPVDFQVAVNAAGAFEIQDAGDQPLPNLRPAVAADAAGVAQVVQRLVHLAKYRNVRALDVPDASAPQILEVTVAPVDGAGSQDGRALVLRPGDWAVLTFKNLLPPNPADPNDPSRVLNVTVLGLNADWSIGQAYPAEAGKAEPMDPGQTIELPFPAALDDGNTEETTIFKVFATRATTAFRWLELPALDQPDLAAAGLRGEIDDPLEALLARFSAPVAARKLKFNLPATPAERRWTVAQVEVVVRAE